MQRFQIWAHPWWVNLVLLVPALSYLGWRRKGLLLSWRKLSVLALFGVAFGFVEAVVVVYLRTAAEAVGHYSSAISQPHALNNLSAGSIVSCAAPREPAHG